MSNTEVLFDRGNKNYIDNLPKTDGQIMFTTDQEHNKIYTDVLQQDGTVKRIIIGGDTSEDKMDKVNPIGSGAFSLNRKENSDVGEYSFAEGYDTTASGDYSHAEGRTTLASAFASHSEGNRTKADGDSSHAEGSDTKAIGGYSHAEGITTEAKGLASHSEGGNFDTKGVLLIDRTVDVGGENIDVYGSQSYGTQSHAEGTQTLAYGYSSHSEGVNTNAIGIGSHTEGDKTTASGGYSHAEGGDTIAIGISSHAEGGRTTANGNYAHAEGYKTTAGGSSHSEGYGTEASGISSHSEGRDTKAIGNYSHSGGYGTEAKSKCQTAIGQYNEIDENDKYLFIVGNGQDAENRSNAFTVGLDGSINDMNITIEDDKLCILYKGTRYEFTPSQIIVPPTPPIS